MSRIEKHFEEYVEICPYCRKKSLVVRSLIYEIPYVGKALLFSKKCYHCGYSHADILPLEIREPIRIRFKVKKEDDLCVKIIRSPFATIRVPELGVDMTPGPLAPMFYTNVEGLLERLEDLGETFKALALSEEDKRRAEKYLERVKKIKSELDFTIEIEDPYGLSTIIVLDEEQKRRLSIEKSGDVDVETKEEGERKGKR
ncbi:MAG: hypothetical protein DRJ59_02850 [Thermoprotei archaeon]|nr:MAG: hypothetical protein DRJ59_02850 [Thermoprotei archaeon]